MRKETLMKEEQLLYALGQVKDRYIRSAAPVAEQAVEVTSQVHYRKDIRRKAIPVIVYSAAVGFAIWGLASVNITERIPPLSQGEESLPVNSSDIVENTTGDSSASMGNTIPPYSGITEYKLSELDSLALSIYVPRIFPSGCYAEETAEYSVDPRQGYESLKISVADNTNSDIMSIIIYRSQTDVPSEEDVMLEGLSEKDMPLVMEKGEVRIDDTTVLRLTAEDIGGIPYSELYAMLTSMPYIAGDNDFSTTLPEGVY